MPASATTLVCRGRHKAPPPPRNSANDPTARRVGLSRLHNLSPGSEFALARIMIDFSASSA